MKQKVEPTTRGRFPWFKFFADDWLFSDTVESLTNEQAGAYLFLLIRQWRSPSGVLPKDPETLARWSRLGARWRTVGAPVRRCFVERHGGIVNLKMRELWEQARDQSEHGKRAAAARWHPNGDGE